MAYKARAFEPNVTGGSSDQVASSLESLIDFEAVDGWEFLAVENHSTVVPGNAGCFGFGASSPYPKTFSVAVFKK